MKSAIERYHLKFVFLYAILLAMIWVFVWYDLVRSREAEMNEARVRLSGQARLFSQYSLANIKRLNEALLDFRAIWHGDQKQFAEAVRHRQDIVQDISFQVGVIDRNGIMQFSNLAKPGERTDLSAREHFRVHQASPASDALFISDPVKGKVSGKWSLQFTRPILKNGVFDGVMVISVSPDLFSGFAREFDVGSSGSFTAIKYSGDVMARYPSIDFAKQAPIDMSDFFRSENSLTRTHQRISRIDNAERIIGFQFLPQYKIVFMSSDRIDTLLIAYYADRKKRVLIALLLSAICLWGCWLLFLSSRAKQRIQQKLVERERVLRQSQEFARIGSYTCKVDSGDFTFSEIALEIMGLLPGSAYNFSALLLMIPPEQRNRMQAELQAVLGSSVQFTVEYPLRRPADGQECWIQVSGQVDNSPGHKQVIGVIQDITERKKYERVLQNNRTELEKLVELRTADLTRTNETLRETFEDLARANSHLIHSEKMASIGQLAAGVAHEINNPIGFVISNMNSLEGYLGKLIRVIDVYEQGDESGLSAARGQDRLQELKLDTELEFIREDIGDLMRESNEGLARVKNIVQNMKDFSHAGEEVWQDADLHHGIDITLNIVSSELKFKAVIVKNYGELPPVECMVAELNQVFMNLLINAGQAIDSGGRITIATGVDGENVWIMIADNGAGMPAHVVNRIFDPFFTTKPVGVGTGLGLSISYNIIKQHKGRIEVSSVPGEGTSFYIHLPVRRAKIVEIGA